MGTENFIVKLFNEFVENLRNDFSDNYDGNTFGIEPHTEKSLKASIFKVVRKKWRIVEDWQIQKFNSLANHYDRMAQVYELLDDDYSKNLYIKLIVYRILDYKRVKLPLNTDQFKNRNTISDNFKLDDIFIEAPFVDGKTIRLHKFDLSKINIPLKMYTSSIYSLIYVNQYENDFVKIEEGDVLLDCGACWGDTALLFANKVGGKGHVFSFEFMPENVNIFNQNIALNEGLTQRVTLIQKALSEQSDQILNFSNNGPGSRVGSCNADSIKVQSITIDDFAETCNMKKIDFIKMDIEGSELPALKGAVKVLNKYRPKLAISIYHSIDDFVNIPIFLNSLNLGYRFFIKHGTIHQDETVLLAISE